MLNLKFLNHIFEGLQKIIAKIKFTILSLLCSLKKSFFPIRRRIKKKNKKKLTIDQVDNVF